MKNIKSFYTFNEGIISNIANKIWKSNDDCQEIFDYIKDIFNIKNLKKFNWGYGGTEDRDGFTYDDGVINFTIKENYIGKDYTVMREYEITVDGQLVNCSPLMSRKFWGFFNKKINLGKHNIDQSMSKIRGRQAVRSPFKTGGGYMNPPHRD